MLILQAFLHSMAARFAFGSPLRQFETDPSPPEQKWQRQQGEKQNDVHGGLLSENFTLSCRIFKGNRADPAIALAPSPEYSREVL